MAEKDIAPRPPIVVATEGYLNDPIKFNADPRFFPITALARIPSASLVERNALGHIKVNTNADETQNYAVPMRMTVYNRFDLPRVIDTQFKRLITPPDEVL